MIAALFAIVALAVGLAAGRGGSAQGAGRMYGCPAAGRWAIAVWSGDSGAAIDEALATCGHEAVGAAYYLDPQTGNWLRWFSGRPEISNLTTLNDLQGIIALGSASASPAATPTPPAGQDSLQNCPLAGKWAISVWSGEDDVGVDQALATCGPGAVSAAYYLDPQTGGWLRWFRGRPDISNLATLNNLQGIIALGPGGFTLSFDKFGEGTVTSSPAGIDCGAGCTSQAVTFAPDSSVVLTAAADPGSTFSHWSGCDSVSGNSCTVDMDGDNTVFATFAFSEVKIPETTKVLDAATMGYLIRQEGSTYYFDLQATAVASLKAGDVIVSGVGEGFLRKVTAVHVTDQEIAVETADATLEDAIERGTLLLSEQGASAAGTLSAQDLTAADVTCIIDELKCSFPINVDLGDGVKITGFASFDADADIDVSFDWWHVGEIRSVFTLSGETTLTAIVGRNFSGTAKTTVPVLKTTKIFFIGVVPTVVSLDLSLEVGVTGSAKAGLESTVSIDNTFAVGGHYLRDQDWSAINDYSRTLNHSEPSFSLEADAKAYVKPVLNMKVDAVAGPYFDVEGFLKARVAPLETPWWTLKAGIGAEAGFRAGAFGLSVVDFTLPLWEQEWLLAQAQTQPPAPTSTPSATPTPTPTHPLDLAELIAQEKARQEALGWTLDCPDSTPKTREIIGTFDHVNDHWIAILCESGSTEPLRDRLVIYERQVSGLVPLLDFVDARISELFLGPLADVQGDGLNDLPLAEYIYCNDISCNKLRIYDVQNHKAIEIPVALPVTGLVGIDHWGDGTSAVPEDLEDLNGDGKQEIVAVDVQWVIHGFCHACSPYASYVLNWDGQGYVNASREARFQGYFDDEIAQYEGYLSNETRDDYRMSRAISILLLYGHSGRASQGWARFYEIVAGLKAQCWKDMLPILEADLELSVPKDGSEPPTSAVGSPSLKGPVCLSY